ncbi:MAG: hypothetical protein HZA77_02170 [Candidatus Schekmanbacteria bacterium]|nr:hypothetical protein [Candidatus Schekmanbacteria bacterium]
MDSNTVFSGIVALSTVVYAILTFFLVKETRKLREAQTEPRVDVTYRMLEIGLSFIDIVVRNTGNGPAYDIKFEIIPETNSLSTRSLIEELNDKSFIRNGIKYLSIGQELRSYFTNLRDDFEGKTSAIIRIKVTFKSKTNQTYREEYLIDFSEMKGMERLGEPPLNKIAYQIEKIQNNIDKICTGFSKLHINIYTNEDRNREKKEREQFRKEMLDQTKSDTSSDKEK